MSDKHIIWSNRDLHIDDWRAAYAEHLEIKQIATAPAPSRDVEL